MRAPGQVLRIGALALGGFIPDAAASIIDTSGVVQTGDFDDDGNPELVVSAPETTPTQTFHQDITDVVDEAEAGDFFGWRLVPGKADDDAYPDLFVTVPGDACTTAMGSGQHGFYGSAGGLAVDDNPQSQDSCRLDR